LVKINDNVVVFTGNSQPLDSTRSNSTWWKHLIFCLLLNQMPCYHSFSCAILDHLLVRIVLTISCGGWTLNSLSISICLCELMHVPLYVYC